MAWLVIIFVMSLSIPYLIWRNYQLEKRWRCVRYCWHTMSDFCGERLSIDGQYDHQWKDVVHEHQKFMNFFGGSCLSDYDIKEYESALLERNISPLTEHRL